MPDAKFMRMIFWPVSFFLPLLAFAITSTAVIVTAGRWASSQHAPPRYMTRRLWTAAAIWCVLSATMLAVSLGYAFNYAAERSLPGVIALAVYDAFTIAYGYLGWYLWRWTNTLCATAKSEA